MGHNKLYDVNKNIDKLYNRGYSNFLSPSDLKNISYKLKKGEYDIYYPYKESDKVIIYRGSIPDIKLCEIVSYNKLTHREILGSLFGLNITNDSFGDIVIYNNRYYVFLMNDISEFVINNLNMIGNNYVKVKYADIDIIKDYEREFLDCYVIVSSLRIDTVISRIININRDNVKDIIKDKEVILNYEVLNNNSYVLKKGDIFSIRGYGKYKYIGIDKTTKKDNYIILYKKYL